MAGRLARLCALRGPYRTRVVSGEWTEWTGRARRPTSPRLASHFPCQSTNKQVDPSIDGAIDLQLLLEAPSPASRDTMLPLSLHFLQPTHAPALVDPDQTEKVLWYHLPMLNDAARNAAYAAWLRWALFARRRQEDGAIRVLDIGAGSGLLGMMAGRLGRELGLEVEVVCLEKVPVLAAAAGWAVEENGLGDCVTVVNELSSDVAAADLGA